MKFIDECQIELIAGKGGNGIVSFLRAAREPRGGPDGGNGGHGGSIYFQGHPGLNTLFNLKHNKIIRGQNGGNGQNKNKYGAYGKNIVVFVPLGTLVFENDDLICDIKDEEKYLIAKGGLGGKGNAKFKSSHNTAPKLCENGLPGERKEIKLVLKVLADVGFVGKPSVGKSTLLSKITNAKPRIAEYHFTTLIPQLGIVSIAKNTFVAADLPGLIKGAAEGKGLGHDFLKHIERCKVIAHILDFSDENLDFIKDFQNISNELKNYDLGLENRPIVVVANKIDASEHWEAKIKKFNQQFPLLKIVPISALEETNLKELKYALFKTLQTAPEIIKEINKDEITINLKDDINVQKIDNNTFLVDGAKVERFYYKIPLNTDSNFKRWNAIMKKIGVWKLLRQKGIKNGNIVKIFEYEFEWMSEE